MAMSRSENFEIILENCGVDSLIEYIREDIRSLLVDAVSVLRRHEKLKPLPPKHPDIREVIRIIALTASNDLECYVKK